MRTSPPRWAADLAARVCAEAGVAVPRLEWLPASSVPKRLRSRRTTYRIAGLTLDPNRELSAGSTYFGEETIRVWHGTLRASQRLVLLHELAHWIVRGFHTDRFWDEALRLYKRYAPTGLAFAVESEARYRTGALRAAVRAGLVSAADAATRPGLQKERLP